MILTIYNPLSFIPTRTSNCQNKCHCCWPLYLSEGFDLLIKHGIVNKTIGLKHMFMEVVKDVVTRSNHEFDFKTTAFACCITKN